MRAVLVEFRQIAVDELTELTLCVGETVAPFKRFNAIDVVDFLVDGVWFPNPMQITAHH